jgi:hypothetical protein
MATLPYRQRQASAQPSFEREHGWAHEIVPGMVVQRVRIFNAPTMGRSSLNPAKLRNAQRHSVAEFDLATMASVRV